MVAECLGVKGSQVQILSSRHCRPDAADEGGVRLGWTPSYLRVWGEPAILVEMSEIHLKITI
jgi:hypothetical protein